MTISERSIQFNCNNEWAYCNSQLSKKDRVFLKIKISGNLSCLKFVVSFMN